MEFSRSSICRTLLIPAISLISVTSSDWLLSGEGPDYTVSTPTLSEDGRFIGFESGATNLIPGQMVADSPFWNVFWMDRQTRRVYNAQTAGLDKYEGGAFNPVICRNGDWIVFQSSNNGIPGNDGRSNIFVSSVRARAGDGAPPSLFRMLSKSAAGEAGNGISKIPAISSDGRFVVFKSNATNLTSDLVSGGNEYHHFLLDRDFDDDDIFDEPDAGATRMILMGGPSLLAHQDDLRWPSISADGMKIFFFADTGPKWWNNGAIIEASGTAGGFTPEGTLTLSETWVYDPTDPGAETFYRYRTGGTETFKFPDHAEGNVPTSQAHLVLTSTVAALDQTDTNGERDIYLIDRVNKLTTLVSSGVGGAANGSSGTTGPFRERNFDITASGRFIAFVTRATNMGFDDNNDNLPDIIIIDRQENTRDRVEAAGTTPVGKTPAQIALEKKIEKLLKSIKAAKKKKKRPVVKRLQNQLKAARRQLAGLR